MPRLYNTSFRGCKLTLQQWVVDSTTYYPIAPVQLPSRIAHDVRGDRRRLLLGPIPPDAVSSTPDQGHPRPGQSETPPPTTTTTPGDWPTPPIVNRFILDGRFLRLQRGAGQNAHQTYDIYNNANQPVRDYPNFLYNGLPNPTLGLPNIPVGYNDPNSSLFNGHGRGLRRRTTTTGIWPLQTPTAAVIAAALTGHDNLVYDPLNPPHPPCTTTGRISPRDSRPGHRRGHAGRQPAQHRPPGQVPPAPQGRSPALGRQLPRPQARRHRQDPVRRGQRRRRGDRRRLG